MERSTSDVEQGLQREGDDMENRLEQLDEHIDEARDQAQARTGDSDTWDETAGDWEDTDDAAGGEDPSEFDDPDAAEDDED
jgi:cellobiose phosphorylase